MGRSGTGLGLAVVWNVVQDHKGYIDVTSDEKGTIFKLYFPITREEIPETDEVRKTQKLEACRETGRIVIANFPVSMF